MPRSGAAYRRQGVPGAALLPVVVYTTFSGTMSAHDELHHQSIDKQQTTRSASRPQLLIYEPHTYTHLPPRVVDATNFLLISHGGVLESKFRSSRGDAEALLC